VNTFRNQLFGGQHITVGFPVWKGTGEQDLKDDIKVALAGPPSDGVVSVVSATKTQSTGGNLITLLVDVADSSAPSTMISSNFSSVRTDWSWETGPSGRPDS
jgi:hypothetical protein